MFDTTIVKQAPAYPQTVHEHRAPTDASVRLLNEMQDKAKENFVGSIMIDDNIIKGAIYVMQDFTYHNTFAVVFKFNINGKEFVIDEDFRYNPYENKSMLIKRFYDEFSKKITEYLVNHSINQIQELLR
jgi:hypothetical protein